jgi:hypothetical protein
MRKVVVLALSAVAIGLAFAPGAGAAPANPAAISEAAKANPPVVKAWWYGRRYVVVRRGWRRCWRCW